MFDIISFSDKKHFAYFVKYYNDLKITKPRLH